MMKQNKKRIVGGLILILMLCVALVLGTGMTVAESPAAGIGEYQGKDNWYYLTGKFEENDLTRMARVEKGGYYLGYGYWNLIMDSGVQGTDGGYDAIRAYVAPQNGTLTIAGSILNRNSGESDGTYIQIVKAPYDTATSSYLKESQEAIVAKTLFKVGDADIAVNKELTVNAGDIIYFVANQNVTPNNDGVVYSVSVTLKNAVDANYSYVVPFKSFNFNTGAFDSPWNGSNNIDVNRAGEILKPLNRTTDTFAMVSGNTTNGFTLMKVNDPPTNNMYKGQTDHPYLQYANQINSNPQESTAYRYKVPADGVVNVVGKFRIPSGNKMECYKKSEGVFTTLASNSTALTMIGVETLAEFQNIVVKAGDELYVAYVSNEYWKAGNSVIAYDFWANPTKNGEVPPKPKEDEYTETPDVPQHEYVSTGWGAQGENGWYKLYGNAESEYYKMKLVEEGGDKRWVGDMDWNSICWAEQFTPGQRGEATHDAIFMWQAPFNGSVTFDGFFSKGNMTDCQGIEIRIQDKKSPSSVSTDIFSRVYTKPFTKLVNHTMDVVAGEMVFFSVGRNIDTANSLTNVKMFATFVKDEANPGTPVSGIGDSYDLPNLDYESSVSGEQGVNGWYKLYGNAESDYYKMTRKLEGGDNRWVGLQAYNNICWYKNFGPDGGDDAILMWQAPFNGKVTLTGKISGALNASSDGVKFLMQNKKSPSSVTTNLFEQLFTGDFVHYIKGECYDVVAGEMMFFAIDQNITSAYDGAVVQMFATFIKDEANPGTPVTGIGDKKAYKQEDYDAYFGETQNYNNWYYLYGDVTGKYYPMTYSASKWNGSEDYTGIMIDNQHPGILEQAIKMWRAPNDGVADIAGQVSGDYVGGNGIRASLYLRKWTEAGYGVAEIVEGFDQTLDSVNKRYDFYIREMRLTRGDMLFFVVDSLGANPNDSTKFNAIVDFTKSAEGTDAGTDIGLAKVININDSYGVTQGYKNWFFMYGFLEKYAYMEWSQNNWIGRDDYLAIDVGNQHPGVSLGAMKMYIADRDGTLNILGNAQKLANGGDGVRATICHNGTTLWNKDFAKDDTTAVDFGESFYGINVKKGDRLMFFVDCGGIQSNAFDSFIYRIGIEYTAQGDNYVEGEDLSKFTGAVSHLEVIGVTVVPDKEDGEPSLDAGGAAAGCGSIGMTSGGNGGGLMLGILSIAFLFLHAKVKRTLCVKENNNK